MATPWLSPATRAGVGGTHLLVGHPLVQQEAHDQRGDGGDDQQPAEQGVVSLEGLFVPDAEEEGTDDVPVVLPEKDQQGKDRSQLDDHVEGENFVTFGNAECSLADEQMRGGRDGDELSQSLDDAEEERLEEGHGMSVFSEQLSVISEDVAYCLLRIA